MKPIFLDLHIHTSLDPNNLNEQYDIDKLIEKIEEFTDNSQFLISLTDHNTINKEVYLAAKNKIDNLLIGVELHIKNYPDKPPYHCHMYFNIDNIESDILDELKTILDKLYPNKVVSREDDNIPSLENVIKNFDKFEFVLLPHGGQSHSTFDKSIPDGVRFDSSIERSIYYNQFDGFTARGNTGLEKTQDYFKKLGILDFVNLITCSDNYNPINYPNAKSSQAHPFVPTWMFALPTFNGLRLSLSESSRLIYSNNKPIVWSESIKNVTLHEDNIDIDVELTPGLNVVIGGSSSGKTLFVDSLYRKIHSDFIESQYNHFNVENIYVVNPSGIHPHYLSQNYIMSVVNSASDDKLESIDIVKNVFPGDDSIREKVDLGLLELKSDLKEIVKCIKIIEQEDKNLKTIPILSSLLNKQEVKENFFKFFVPSSEITDKIDYTKHKFEQDNQQLDLLNKFLEQNPFVEHDNQLIIKLKDEMQKAYDASKFENKIRNIIQTKKKEYDEVLKAANVEEQTKKQHFDSLLESIKTYSKAYVKFKNILEKVSRYSIKCDSESFVSMEHTLYIQNDFELNKEKFLSVINHYLKTGFKIDTFDDIIPEKLYQENFKRQMPKVNDYDDFEKKINKDFENFNKKTYKIVTSRGQNFDRLSAGWKTSVILDIILGYDRDIAPIIIDQPEDNLATNYINKGLVKAIKKIKSKKQIILVSHNATIPMLADAQNIVLCRNIENKIKIKSNRLEGMIDDKNVLDYIADITDGGKPSIKKRVKKYNLKNFKN